MEGDGGTKSKKMKKEVRGKLRKWRRKGGIKEYTVKIKSMQNYVKELIIGRGRRRMKSGRRRRKQEGRVRSGRSSIEKGREGRR